MLIDRLKADATYALKSRNDLARSIIQLVISDSEARSNGSPVTDEVVISVCRKIIESNNETMKHGGDSVKLNRENAILAEYVPSESSIEEVIAQLTPDVVSQVKESKTRGQGIGFISKFVKKTTLRVSGESLGKVYDAIYGN